MKKIVFVRYGAKEELASAKKTAKSLKKEYDKLFGKGSVSVLVVPSTLVIETHAETWVEAIPHNGEASWEKIDGMLKD